MSAPEIRLFGLPNCDSCRAARRWLEAHACAYRFSDVREEPVSAARLRRWLDAVGDQLLVNRRSTTWRNLDATQRAAADTAKTLMPLLQAHPTLLKRPILEAGTEIRVGFSTAAYAEFFDGDR